MRILVLVALLLAACVSAPRDSAPRDEAPDHERAVYENVTVAQVRQAALQVVSGLYRFMDPARVTEDGRVVAESGIGDWTTYEVRFVELEDAVAAKVDVRSPSCRTRMASPSYRAGRGVPIFLEGGHVEYVSRPVVTSRSVRERTEAIVQSGPKCSTGTRDRTRLRILDEIRAVLESEEPTLD